MPLLADGSGTSPEGPGGNAHPRAQLCFTDLDGHRLRSPDCGDRLAGSTDAASVLPRAPAWIKFLE